MSPQAAHEHDAGAGAKRRGAWQLGTVRGIPIRVHWSLLAVLPFFAAVLAVTYFPATAELPLAWGILWGSLLAIALFASVLLHELSHSFLAMRYGITVRGITLLPIGGISEMEKMPERPGQELRVSAVGPLTNFVIAAPLLAASLTGIVPALLPGLPAFVQWAGWINLVLGVFNFFLPAFPMDGGRMLRALLATRMGRVKATQRAAATGRVLAFIMGLVGVLTLGVGGILLLVIAFFIFMGATGEERMVINEETLRGLTVAELMTARPVTVAPDDSMDAVFRTMTKTKHVAFPVVERDGSVVGCISLAEFAEFDRDRLTETRVRDRMNPNVTTLQPGMPAQEAMSRLLTRGEEHLVVARDGHLDGFLTRTDLERTLRIAQSLQAEAG